jgi:hypothetical protein
MRLLLRKRMWGPPLRNIPGYQKSKAPKLPKIIRCDASKIFETKGLLLGRQTRVRSFQSQETFLFDRQFILINRRRVSSSVILVVDAHLTLF